MYPTANRPEWGAFVESQVHALADLGACVGVVHFIPYLPRKLGRVVPRLKRHAVEASDVRNGSGVSVRRVRYPSVPGARRIGWLRVALKMRARRLAASWDGIDVVHAHPIVPAGHAALLMARNLDVPCLATVHGLELEGAIRRPSARREIEQVAQQLDQVVTVSDWQARWLRERLGVRAVRNYIGVDPVSLFRRSPTRCESDTYAEGSVTRFLFVGRLSREKGIIALLDAAKIVASRYTRFTLTLVGDGPLATCVKRGMRDLEEFGIQVEWPGAVRRTEVFRYMMEADVLLAPSLSEGLPMAVVEGGMAGLPVIASDLPGIREIIRPDATGVVVQPDCPQDLAEAMRQAVSDRQRFRGMGRRLQHEVNEKFRLRENAEELMGVYKSLADCYGEHPIRLGP